MTRLTLRARFTLAYGGLFTLAGLVLLAITYALVSKQVPDFSGVVVSSTEGELGSTSTSTSTTEGQVTAIADMVRSDALEALLTQGGLALGLVVVVAIVVAWLLAGRMLQPVHRITDTARRIAATPAVDRGLRERIALAGPDDELKELADTFDGMLAALDHSFDGQRRFIANASHELRTPLTVNRALLEVALHRGSGSAEVRQLAETLLEVNARHERLIEGLLLLARSEQIGEGSYVDLADVVDHVCAQLPAGSVTVRTDTDEAGTTGNPILLERLVQNLVDNAVRHNVGSGGWVRVATRTAPDGGAVLEVANTGAVVPRYELPSLFEPFRRLADERQATGGVGLGLSIVRAIATAHGGSVQADSRDGGGLVVTVHLPGAGAWDPLAPAGPVASESDGS